MDGIPLAEFILTGVAVSKGSGTMSTWIANAAQRPEDHRTPRQRASAQVQRVDLRPYVTLALHISRLHDLVLCVTTLCACHCHSPRAAVFCYPSLLRFDRMILPCPCVESRAGRLH